jgi:translation elongation factor P/translation initiation factor 5A
MITSRFSSGQMIISKGQGYVILKPDTTPKGKENIIIQILTSIISSSQMITSIYHPAR